ncbi:MAG: c-type cytochrome [Bacteroidota bacterium]|jgi:mono/diheme cytochrome c family protein|nr:c-type cytochrome [Bacteroidota bacterium]
MLRFKKIVFQSIALVAIVLFSNFSASAQDGKAIFQANCASCHNPIKDATGPALQGVDKRVPSKEWIYNWVHNSAKVISSGDKYANDLYNKWNKTAMTAFPQLSNAEIDAVVKYVNDYKAPSATPAAGAATSNAPEEDNSNMYILVTLALLVLMVILWKVNSGLKRVANEKQGLPNVKEIPFYRNKLFVAIAIILAFILAGYWIANGSIEMGRQQNYKPEQPIFYSHKVHAGINQINCLYCHAGAEKSKHAMVPSTNVCMNCHKQINEYTGEAEHPLYNEEGEKINGTEQIQLLYKYAGWDPVKKDYIRDEKGAIQATPIKWTKIHNLPDHVYFNHSQHVAVGKVPCQQCHGPIQEMDEVYQFSPLSMGWCINCHRQTKVQFENNNYYSIFEKYHQELKDKKRDGVTVEEIGGLECQRCHY